LSKRRTYSPEFNATDLHGGDQWPDDDRRNRVFSSYATAEHGMLWIITNDIRGEGEGPITTVMFPEDY